MRGKLVKFSSLQFSHSVVSNSLGPHGLQHTRLPCPSSAPAACSNQLPLLFSQVMQRLSNGAPLRLGFLVRQLSKSLYKKIPNALALTK